MLVQWFDMPDEEKLTEGVEQPAESTSATSSEGKSAKA
jgi:hypothetical protein